MEMVCGNSSFVYTVSSDICVYVDGDMNRAIVRMQLNEPIYSMD